MRSRRCSTSTGGGATHPRLADGEPGHQVREAERRVLPVPGHLRAARRRRCTTSADFAQALLEKEHVVVTPGEGVRRAGLPAHLLRDVDGAAARGRHAHPALRRVAAARQPAHAEPWHARRGARGAVRHRRLVLDRVRRALRRGVVGAASSASTIAAPIARRLRRPTRSAEATRPTRRRSRRTPRRSPPSRGSATRTACRSSCAARAPATPAARCRRAAASCCRWSGSIASSRSTRSTCSPSSSRTSSPPICSARSRARRPVLSAGSGQPRPVVHRRQRRGMRRRAARVQVRHDQALRAGARSGAADRRDHPTPARRP